MNPLLLKATLLLQAALLAMPTGWCCGMAASVFSPPAGIEAVTKSCCASHTPVRQEGQRDGKCPAPARNSLRCCCNREATLQQDAVRPDAPQLALFDAVESPPTGRVSAVGTSPGFSFATGPPLHVLQCVWRC